MRIVRIKGDIDMKMLVGGLSVSKGLARGVARVIKNSFDFHSFKTGDILITEFAGPIFTPVIVKASAVVTDRGGLLCHAAIICRELGIPCIVGSENATMCIKYGTMVLVDAEKKRGLVYELM